ncbi:hypothetical protein IGI57_001731 [Enterococcus sp. DIV0213j]
MDPFFFFLIAGLVFFINRFLKKSQIRLCKNFIGDSKGKGLRFLNTF